MLYRFPRFRIFLYLPLNIVFYFIVGRLFLLVEKFRFFYFFYLYGNPFSLYYFLRILFLSCLSKLCGFRLLVFPILFVGLRIFHLFYIHIPFEYYFLPFQFLQELNFQFFIKYLSFSFYKAFAYSYSLKSLLFPLEISGYHFVLFLK